MTESAYFASAAQKDCFSALGVEQYKIVASFDQGTCELCGAMDGRVFKMSEYQPGLTAPPFHPWCRCCTAPYFEDLEGWGQRAARDAATGEAFTVPRDMTYGEWKEEQDARYGKGAVEKLTGSDLTRPYEDSTINDSFIIGRSVGAKAKNYHVIDKTTGAIYQFVEGTKIKNPTVFAGYHGVKPLAEATLEGLLKEFGGSREKWQHVKGIGVLDVDGEEIAAEVHWFQEETVGKVKFKVKEWLE